MLSLKAPLKYQNVIMRYSSFYCNTNPIVAVLDATTTIGTNLSFLLKQNTNIKELRLYDQSKDTFAMARDLNEIDTSIVALPFAKRSLRKAIVDAHVVISVGGCQTQAGQSQMTLFERNVDNIRNVALFLSEFNPKAIYCIAKPPIEALVPMVSEEYKKADRYDPRKIIGVTAPMSVVTNRILATYSHKNPNEVLCPLIGGCSPRTTIPVISQARPQIPYGSKVYSKLQDEVANSEERLLAGGARFFYSRALAISRFVNSVLKGLKGESCAESAYVAQVNHIGDFLPYMTSIVKLGREGVESSHMPQVNELEASRLRSAMPYITDNILLGQTFASGDFAVASQLKKKRRCDDMLKQKLEEYHLK